MLATRTNDAHNGVTFSLFVDRVGSNQSPPSLSPTWAPLITWGLIHPVLFSPLQGCHLATRPTRTSAVKEPTCCWSPPPRSNLTMGYHEVRASSRAWRVPLEFSLNQPTGWLIRKLIWRHNKWGHTHEMSLHPSCHYPKSFSNFGGACCLNIHS